MMAHVFAWHDQTGPAGFWYEIEPEGKDEVIHTDGMYPTAEEAIRAGEEWAREHGYDLSPMPGP